MPFEKILAGFEKKPLGICSGLCSGNRNKKSSCRECVDVCPRGLLKKGGDGLSREIDLAACNSCGLCATVCPNGVFEVREPSDTAILKKIDFLLKKKGKLTIGCLGGEREEGCDLTVRCLGRLHEAILVAAAAMGAQEIRLKKSVCEVCANKNAFPVIERSVENSRKLLLAFGKDIKIAFLEKTHAAEPRSEENERMHGRREFLKILKGEALAFGAVVAEVAIQEIEEKISLRQEQERLAVLEHRVPAKRRMLISFMRKLGEPRLQWISGASLSLAQVGIQDNCSLCERCIQFCPTGALRSRSNRGTKGIDFHLSLCTGCGLCILACFDGLLSLSDMIETVALIKDEPKRLVLHEIYSCANCRREYWSPSPGKFCSHCERKMKLRNAPW